MLPVVTALNTLSLQTFDKFKKQRTCHFCYHFISLSRDAGKYESMSEKLHVITFIYDVYLVHDTVDLVKFSRF